MRKVFLLAGIVLASISISFAQATTPKWEIFGGYSYLRSNPKNAPSGDSNGWNASANWNLFKHIGIKADIDGHYCCGGEKEHNFLFGPQLTMRFKKSNIFFHLLGGVSHGSAQHFSDNVAAWAAGGGWDYALSSDSRWAVRVAQVDYLMTHYADQPQHNFRYSGGVVFRFGKR